MGRFGLKSKLQRLYKKTSWTFFEEIDEAKKAMQDSFLNFSYVAIVAESTSNSLSNS